MKKMLMIASVFFAVPALAETNADLRAMYEMHEENELAFRKQYGNRELVFDAVVRSVEADAAMRMSGFNVIEIPGANIDAPGVAEGIFPMAVAMFADEDDLMPLRRGQRVRLKCTVDFDTIEMVSDLYFKDCVMAQ